MERRTYIWEFTGNEEEAYAVIAHAGRYGVPKQRHYLPMKMQVQSCECDGDKIDFAGLIYSSAKEDEYLNAEFLQNRTKILRGERPEWILVEFEPVMTGIYLRYYNRGFDVKEEIYLHVSCLAKESAKLHMRFEVPHTNGKPDTHYLFVAECRPDRTADNFILLESFSQDTQKCISFCIDHRDAEDNPVIFDRYDIVRPAWADVTEYTDI